MPRLKQDPKLRDFQDYVQKMEKERGFDNEQKRQN